MAENINQQEASPMLRTLSLLVLIALASMITACSPPTADSAHVPPKGAPGPDAHSNFPSYAGHDAREVEALRDASAEDRDGFCKTYCASELSWPAEQFTKSSIENFYQTPEPTDLRCDYSETNTDIGGSERHTGSWILDQCEKRGLEGCYWSINFGRRHEARVACIRPVFPSQSR
jgi:hypothetical protein